MNQNSPDDWQELFNELPIDVTVDENKLHGLKQQALQTYDERTESSWWTNRLSKTGNYLMTHKTPRWAATAAALLLAAWIFISPGTQSTFAMEKLIQNVLNARNVRFVMSVKCEGVSQGEIKIFCEEPARMRQELSEGVVAITDFEIGKAVTLDSAAKTATVSLLPSATDTVGNEEFTTNYFDVFRNVFSDAQKNPNDKIKLVGEKEIDGRKLVGFEFVVPTKPMTIWADPTTNQPYLITLKQMDPAAMEITMSNFEFNVELEDDLFSVEIPEGYKQMDMQLPREEHLIESLMLYSEASGGQFPDELSLKLAFDYAADIPVVGEDGKIAPAFEKKLKEVTMGVSFATGLSQQAKAHYAGKDVVHGKSDRPIFWYWLEEDQTWRVLGANLKFQNATSAPDIEGAVPHLPLEAQKQPAAELPPEAK